MEINLTDQVLILDEAHNMEDSSREAASFSLTHADLQEAVMDLNRVMGDQKVKIPEHRRVRDAVS